MQQNSFFFKPVRLTILLLVICYRMEGFGLCNTIAYFRINMHTALGSKLIDSNVLILIATSISGIINSNVILTNTLYNII